MMITSNSKFFKDKYSGNYTGDIAGLKFEGNYQGDKNVIHFTSPFIKAYLDTDYVSIDMSNYYKNQNIDIIKLNEKNEKANYEFGKYIFHDVGIENLLVVSEGVDEEIIVNGESQKIEKFNAKINHETIKENSIIILEYIVNNSEVLEVLTDVHGEGYKESYLKNLNEIILEIKELSDEDYITEYEKLKPHQKKPLAQTLIDQLAIFCFFVSSLIS